ncbi:MAG: C4-dicarboxylate TRAP transporter substrate-binding protein [Hyphomicrobiaceae bacterium]
MKRTTAVLTAALIGLAGAAGPAAAAKSLKAAFYVPPKHPIGQGYQVLADEVKKETKGSVTIRLFGGESLLGAKAIADGVRDQVADMGQVVYTYTPSYFPHGILVNDMALVGENDMAAMMALTELYLTQCAGCLAELGKQGQIPMTALSTPPYVVIATGDFNSPEKMRLKKLRAGGALWDRFSKAIGAVAVNMPTSGMYEGMSRGTLDGALYAVGGLKTHGLGDVAKQVVMLNSGSFRAGAMYTMNIATWKSLTVDERKAFLKATPKAAVHASVAYAKGEEEGVEVAKAKNIPIVEPHPELLKMRNEFVENDLKQTVKHAEEKLGLSDASEFVANYRKLYDKYEKLVKPLGNDEAKLSEVMYTEIFAKLDPATFGMK